MKTKAILFLIVGLVITAFRYSSDSLFSIPKNWPKPIYDFSKNPITENKVELGRELFYDPLLSRNNTISCASCHSQYNAFTHVDHALSHGIEDKIGTRNSPALMNLAWQDKFMRDGAINHLDVQALAPISNPIEMDESILHIVNKLQASTFYKDLFYKAYGDSLVTGEHTLKAISAFMLTLVSSNSKYDSVMRKESVFTTQENNGYALFKKNCNACHAEPLFTNNDFMNNGLNVDTTLNDYGRYRITQNVKDSLKFKVPTLRNVEFSYPYMHDGRFKKLSEVIKHYTEGIKQSSTLASELKKAIELSSNERVDLTAFLLTLTDRSFLFNPNYSFPRKNLVEATNVK